MLITRRTLLRTGSAASLSLAAGGLAAPAIAQGAKIRLGYVSPQSGPLAGFAESDAFNIQAFLASEAGELAALEVETGAVRWRRREREGVQATPLAAAGTLYVAFMNGTLRAYREGAEVPATTRRPS